MSSNILTFALVKQRSYESFCPHLMQVVTHILYWKKNEYLTYKQYYPQELKDSTNNC